MSGRILDKVVDKTKAFLEQVPKSRRKKKGQFFTPPETAEYMAGMFDFSGLPEDVRILDPGAGSGILSAAVVDRLNDMCCPTGDEDNGKPTNSPNYRYRLTMEALGVLRSLGTRNKEYALQRLIS